MKKETFLKKFIITCRNCADHNAEMKFDFQDTTATTTFLCAKCGQYEYIKFGRDDRN